MDVSHYLRRIGYEGPLEPMLETLRALHVRHLESVPFENLDIQHKRRIVLDEAAFFDKVVRRRRGGFCYELNGLFAALLETLGFRVMRLSRRVSPDGSWPSCPEFDHLLLEVTLDGPWLVDVGFGDCFAEPIPLVPGVWPSGGTQYRLEQRGEDWALSELGSDGSWKLLYAFSRTPRKLEDFWEMCQYHQTSPDSFFMRQLVCSRKTATGRVTVRGHQLLDTQGPRRSERTLEPEELERVLLEHFGIAPGT